MRNFGPEIWNFGNQNIDYQYLESSPFMIKMGIFQNEEMRNLLKFSQNHRKLLDYEGFFYSDDFDTNSEN